MIIRLINLNDLMLGKISDSLGGYDIIVIRKIARDSKLTEDSKKGIRFGDFEGPIEETIYGEKYAVCRRTN